MASDVEICNRALQKLGATRITSLSENSNNARSCNVAYEPVKKALLRSHTWNFAIKRVELAASATDPVFGRGASYPLPADFLRLLPLDPEDEVVSSDWQIEGKSIITNDADPIYIRYIYNVSDPNEMDSLFLELFSTSLALELCEELTQSNTKKAALKEDRKEILAEARRINAIENVAQQPPEDSWVTCRS